MRGVQSTIVVPGSLGGGRGGGLGVGGRCTGAALKERLECINGKYNIFNRGNSLLGSSSSETGHPFSSHQRQGALSPRNERWGILLLMTPHSPSETGQCQRDYVPSLTIRGIMTPHLPSEVLP